jgi:chromate transporter
MKKYFTLFRSFFLIGALTFGGGYAMLPMLEHEIVKKHGWAKNEDILDMFSVCQCFPGIIAANVSTMVGYRLYGVMGAFFAVLGVVTPSLIIILVIANLLTGISHYAIVQHAFGGIRVAVCVLILSAVKKLWRSSVIDKAALIIFVISFALMLLLDVTPIIIVLAAAVFGIFFGTGKGCAIR